MMLPKKVKVVEVGPRDGFQNLEEWIPTEIKLEVINGLCASGFTKIEATSFVSPKAIPQMKDAKELMKELLGKYQGVVINALVPNLKGAQIAHEIGVPEVTYVISASEEHNLENVRRTIDESFAELAALRKQLSSLEIKVDLATVFGCPFIGNVSLEQIHKMIERVLELEITQICLCDTIGIANPVQTEKILKSVKDQYPEVNFSLHFHDTRGMGLTNVLVALQQGYTEFEASIGGLGGCPFAPGAAGNIATEDMVYMFEQMGIETGINLNKLLETAQIVKNKVKSDLTGHMINVCNMNI